MLGAIGLSFANNLGSKDELTVLAINNGGDDRTPVVGSINAYINGHTLSIIFSQNIGEVSVEISTVFGVVVAIELAETPSGYQCYIPTVGSYLFTITTSNGDEYYGEFEVTD